MFHLAVKWLFILFLLQFGTTKASSLPEEQHRRTKAKKKDSKKSVEVTAGLQPDCFSNDNKRFNICLELNALDIVDGYETFKCIEECAPPFPFAFCFGVDILEGFVDKRWMPAAVEAKNRMQELIVKDTVKPFSPLGLPMVPFEYTTIDNAAFLVDDIHIRIIEGLPGISPNAIALTEVQASTIGGKNQFSAICSITLFGGFCGTPPNYERYIGTDFLTKIFFHEMLHCMGISGRNEKVKEFTVNDSMSRSIWTGPAAKRAWKELGCDGDIPMDGPIGGVHLESSCFQKELMTPTVGTPQGSLLSSITAGILEDIGYKVDYDAVDDFKLDDLGGCACQDFCPKVAKSCSRRLKEPKMTRKGESKNHGSIRKLTPMVNSSTVINETLPPAENPDWVAFMKYLYQLYQDEGGIRSLNTTFNVLLQKEDGSLYDLDATFGDAVSYAQEHGSEITI